MLSYSQILNNHMLKGALVVGLVAAVFASPQVLALDCDDAKPQVIYDPASDDEPQNATPAWEFICSGINGTDQAIISNGILTVSDASDTAKTKYCREDIFDSSCEGSQEAVYEFICKAGTVTENSNAWIPSLVYSCGMADGTYDFRVAISDIDGSGSGMHREAMPNGLIWAAAILWWV